MASGMSTQSNLRLLRQLPTVLGDDLTVPEPLTYPRRLVYCDFHKPSALLNLIYVGDSGGSARGTKVDGDGEGDAAGQLFS